MRSLFSASLFFMSFFLLGDSQAPQVAAPGPATLVSVVVARPMAELCSASPGSLVVVLLPVGKGAWPVEAALRQSLKLALEPGSPDSERAPRWWSLERTASSFLRGFFPDRVASSPERLGPPGWITTQAPEGGGGYHGPL